MPITVTQEHIKIGVPYSKWECPVALAVSQALGPCWVGVDRIGLLKQDRCYPLPTLARDWIHAFDHGRPVEPFSFDV